jgi:hypothetical protein
MDEERQKLILINPDVIVDGHPEEEFVFDLHQPRTMAEFLNRVIIPSLAAANMSWAEFVTGLSPELLSRLHPEVENDD